MSRFIVRAVAAATGALAVGLVATGTSNAFNYVSDANGTFWGIQDVASPRVDTGSIRATQVGAGQSPAYSTTINGYGGIKVWVLEHAGAALQRRADARLRAHLRRRRRFTTTQAVPLGGVEISRAVLIKKDVPAGQASWGRWLDTFHNTTSAPITVKVAFGGQTGYSPTGGNSSAMVKTSSGDVDGRPPPTPGPRSPRRWTAPPSSAARRRR